MVDFMVNESFRDDIVFVILNYNVYDETLDCVNSIKANINGNRYHILIIDNCSPNNSGKRLQEFYNNDFFVKVLITEENLGFAKGNNVGIKYAREKWFPKYICCLNNDTIFLQKDFLTKLEKSYIESNAAVIGPKIILKNDSVQPLMGNLKDVGAYKRDLEINTYGTIPYRIARFKEYVYGYASVHYLKDFIKSHIRDIKSPSSRAENIVLHGCCLIFTPLFFKKLEGFDPRTFLFREEELLLIMLNKNQLTSLYEPELCIKHLEDVSTNKTYSDNNEKNKFLIENQAKSLKILISELSSKL